MAGRVPITVTVNGQLHAGEVEPRLLLVHFLRDALGLTGTHVGCDTSNCGACTVHLDGEAVKSCTVLAVQADGAEVTTIEGIGTRGRPAPGAGGVLGAPRPPVRLLHAGHDHGRRRPARQATPTRPRRRSARRSPATSAAAPATTTSSRRCSTRRRRRRSVDRSERRAEERSTNGKWVGQALQAQGGPAADHRPRPLRRRHRRCRACSTWRSSARPRRTRRSSRSTPPAPRALPGRPRASSPARTSTSRRRPADGLGAAGRRDQDARALAAGQGRGQARRPGASRSSSATTSTRVVDAAEQVLVEYEPLPVVVDPEAALEDGSPLVHEDLGTNKTHEWSLGGGDMDGGLARGRRRRRAADRQPPHRRRADRAARAASPTTAPAS